MKKIVRKRQLFNKKLVLNILLVLFMFLSIGYSSLSTALNINGNVDVKKYVEPTLYNVLKEEAENGGLAVKYTEGHHDSFIEEPTKDIYHWYTEDDTEGAEISNKNNVIFADHCWQMLRTTDTGGVKMIYNGEAENNQCLNTRGTHVGYAARTTQSLSTTYYYGTSYTYDKTNNVFSLDGIVTTGSINQGEYTCKQTSSAGTCATLYLVDTINSGSSYYVLPLNGNSNYSQFGKLQYNSNSSSVSAVSYMYNTDYIPEEKYMTYSETVLNYASSIDTLDWYSDDVVWGRPVANKYNLVNPYRISNMNDAIGTYTFGKGTDTSTYDSIHYIVGVNGSTTYYFQLDDSGNHSLADFNYKYTYGDSYTDNGDGTYTIDNATTINRSEWYTSYSSLKEKYVCKNATNNTCSDLWYVIAANNYNMTYISSGNNYKYSKGFAWDGSKYVLDNDTSVSFWNIGDSSNKTSLNNAHYTCWNLSGECTSISFIFYYAGSLNYINLTNGKNIEDALNEMLHSNDVNSTIKTALDAWYKHYLLSTYDNYIEDTIFCNDRSISSLGGWSSNGDITDRYLTFKDYGADINFSCPNITDRFSTANSSAKLTYKVGLMTWPEMNFIYNKNVLKTGQKYWLASPNRIETQIYMKANIFFINENGVPSTYTPNYAYGVRPTISLKPDTRYISGTGTMADPYIVDTN